MRLARASKALDRDGRSRSDYVAAIDIVKKFGGRLIARKAENGGGRTSFADVDALPMHRRGPAPTHPFSLTLSLALLRNYTARPTEADRSPTKAALLLN